MNKLFFLLAVCTVALPVATEARGPMVFRGDDSTPKTGNWGLATTNSSGVRLNGRIVPIGHAFRDKDAVPASSYLGVWENTEINMPNGPLYNGVLYSRTIPSASGKVVGYVSKQKPAGGGIHLKVTEDCEEYGDKGIIVDPGVNGPFLSCKRVADYGWISN